MNDHDAGLKQSSWSVAGHERLVAFLQKSISRQSCSHAYLFCGPAQVGKKTVADFFIAALLCQSQDRLNVPCRLCGSCQKVFDGNHPNVFFVRRIFDDQTKKLKKNIGIDQIRELQQNFSLKSFNRETKIAVIADADFLSLEAANCLLKTLEEPRGDSIVMLVANNKFVLPLTVLSRCQVLHFSPVADNKIAKYLTAHGMDEKQARYFASLSGGLPGKALMLADDQDLHDEYQQAVKQFISILTSAKIDRLLSVSKISSEYGLDDLQKLLKIWQLVSRDLILLKLGNKGLMRHSPMLNNLNHYVNRQSADYFIKLINSIQASSQLLKASVNPRLALEQIVINL